MKLTLLWSPMKAKATTTEADPKKAIELKIRYFQISEMNLILSETSPVPTFVMSWAKGGYIEEKPDLDTEKPSTKQDLFWLSGYWHHWKDILAGRQRRHWWWRSCQQLLSKWPRLLEFSRWQHMEFVPGLFWICSMQHKVVLIVPRWFSSGYFFSLSRSDKRMLSWVVAENEKVDEEEYAWDSPVYIEDRLPSKNNLFMWFQKRWF